MKTTPLFLLLALTSCTVSHVIGDGTHQSALTCGGFAGTTCAGNTLCVDDPSDSCDPTNGGADCPGLCAERQGTCGGFAGTQCPSGQTCVDDPTDSCDPLHGGADCTGVCIASMTPDAGNPTPDAGSNPQCGGFAGIACATGQTCVDDPTDSCDPAHGGADCGGICVPTNTPDAGVIWCGGFAGTSCPGGQDCVDDPSDGCDPLHGGADCIGMCVPTTGCGADPCGACPTNSVPHDSCSGGGWQCACLTLCASTNPDVCNICPAPLNHLVESNGMCVCECTLP